MHGCIVATKTRGRKRKISDRMVRSVVRKAQEGHMTGRQLWEGMEANVSLRTIQCTLSNDHALVFRPI